MNVEVAENKVDHVFKVTLSAEGIKEDEYKFEVKLAGFFSLEGDCSLGKPWQKRRFIRATLLYGCFVVCNFNY